ncbi:MAG: 5-dehydro-2-deoxygluconokinase [Actinomycetaceae bacterium]|nr:5-dehydro-2-deoxygluconokinase [Actinomycetaceae bacterium]
MSEQMTRAPDVLTIGRCGVDIYPLQVGIGLEEVTSFGKFLGGSSVNVAVAAARLGDRCAIVSGVGDDPFGVFVRREMRRLGVSDQHVVTVPNLNTPVTFCEIFPPDTFPLYFYRQPSAPDLQLQADNLPMDVITAARIFWLTATGLSAQPSCEAHMAALEARGRKSRTILDLDYRADFWRSEDDATQAIRDVLPHVDVVVGNLEECRIAVGETDPERAAQALLDAGVEIAVVKQGPLGTLCMTTSRRIVVGPTQVEVCNGLGAGDAFGGSLCHALLEGWDLPRAIHFASTAGAIVASRLECATAMPTEIEVLHMMSKHPEVCPIEEKV